MNLKWTEKIKYLISVISLQIISFSTFLSIINRRRGNVDKYFVSMCVCLKKIIAPLKKIMLMSVSEIPRSYTTGLKTPQMRQKKCLSVGCLTSQQHASVSQGLICSDNLTCCYTEIEIADQTFHLTQSQYTDTRPTSPSTDPIKPGAWQGSHWVANFFKSLV